MKPLSNFLIAFIGIALAMSIFSFTITIHSLRENTVPHDVIKASLAGAIACGLLFVLKEKYRKWKT